MNRSSFFLKIWLIGLFVSPILSQYCTKNEGGKCVECLPGSHLFQNECFLDIANCQGYEKSGKLCRICQSGFQINQEGTKCVPYQNIIQYSYIYVSEAHQIPTTNFTKISITEYFNSKIFDKIDEINHIFSQSLGELILVDAFKQEGQQLRFQRLIFEGSDSILQTIFISNSTINSNGQFMSWRAFFQKQEQVLIEKVSGLIKQNVDEKIKNDSLKWNDSKILKSFWKQQVIPFQVYGKNAQTYRIIIYNKNQGLGLIIIVIRPIKNGLIKDQARNYQCLENFSKSQNLNSLSFISQFDLDTAILSYPYRLIRSYLIDCQPELLNYQLLSLAIGINETTVAMNLEAQVYNAAAEQIFIAFSIDLQVPHQQYKIEIQDILIIPASQIITITKQSQELQIKDYISIDKQAAQVIRLLQQQNPKLSSQYSLTKIKILKWKRKVQINSVEDEKQQDMKRFICTYRAKKTQNFSTYEFIEFKYQKSENSPIGKQLPMINYQYQTFLQVPEGLYSNKTTTIKETNSRGQNYIQSIPFKSYIQFWQTLHIRILPQFSEQHLQKLYISKNRRNLLKAVYKMKSVENQIYYLVTYIIELGSFKIYQRQRQLYQEI